MASSTTTRKVDLIWNMTLICPHDCQICCVDAVHVSRKGGNIVVRSGGLAKIDQLPIKPGPQSIFDQALEFRQSQGLELNLAGKLRVIDHLSGFDARIDFSGGDALILEENLRVLEVASNRLGREQLTLTATGAGLTKFNADALSPLIGEMNFTYDGVGFDTGPMRPAGYAAANLRKAAQFASRGVRTRAECPLTLENTENEERLTALYLNLRDAGIGKLLLMRLFPVGRGTSHGASVPAPHQYRRAIGFIRELEDKYAGPVVKVQCALKCFDERSKVGMTGNPCDLISESFGLTPDGTLLASPWAVDGLGKPLHDAFVLGNLAATPMDMILQSEKVRAYMPRLDDNLGHCKIFSFFHSSKRDPVDRLFDMADPLYASNKPIAESVLV